MNCRLRRDHLKSGCALNYFLVLGPDRPLQILLYANSSSPDCAPFFMKLQVIVMPKKTVLDPQGVAVRNAIRELGLDGIASVRVGKIVEIEADALPDRSKLDQICQDLLSNPVVEDYQICLPGSGEMTHT
jgi:phosphoribosylformylglycinamidine synthase